MKKAILAIKWKDKKQYKMNLAVSLLELIRITKNLIFLRLQTKYIDTSL